MYDTRLSATHPTGAATQCYIVIHFITITLYSFLQYIQKTRVSNGKILCTCTLTLLRIRSDNTIILWRIRSDNTIITNILYRALNNRSN